MEKDELTELKDRYTNLENIANALLSACQVALIASPSTRKVALEEAIALATNRVPKVAVVDRNELMQLQDQLKQLQTPKEEPPAEETIQ